MTTFQARIDSLPGRSAPDEYDPASSRIPPDSFTVTRNEDGSPLSLYGDMQWDRTPYDPDRSPCVLNFRFWNHGEAQTQPRDDLVQEIHWLMFILIFLRPGRGLSNKTLSGYAKVFRAIARRCEIDGVRIREVLSDPLLSMDRFATPDNAKEIVALARLLRQLGPELVGFEVLDKKSLRRIQKLADDYKANSKQHPALPTRIYSHILTTLHDELKDANTYMEGILRLAKDCYSDPLTGAPRDVQTLKRKKLGLEFDGWRPSFEDLLQRYGLSNFWRQRAHMPNRQGLGSALIEVQATASLQIQAFTGMRADEVDTLPLDCLDIVVRDGVSHYIVKGRVTKLTHGKTKRVQWVTSELGRDAIILAQMIARTIYKAKIGDSNFTKVDFVQYLFVSPSYLWEGKGGKNLPSRLGLGLFPKLRDRLQPIIGDGDINELIQIDPHRAWTAEEKYRVGGPWILTSHQFRRSLALYAQRSGLVSLPSLKRQLHHITLEMAMYYAKGSAFSRNFIDLDPKTKHIGTEWQETQPISQFLAYAAQVLTIDEMGLFGGHVQWLKLRQPDDQFSVVSHNREMTLMRFKKGELAFKATPVGGCANPGPCDKNPIDVLHVECVVDNCKHLVGNIQKAERVIAIKAREVKKLKELDATLPEVRHEAAELKKLVAAVAKAKYTRTKSDPK